MNYNLTNLTDANTTLQYAIATNDLTGGSFFVLILVLAFVIAFTAMKNFDTKTSFMSSAFVTTFLAAILWSVGLVSELVLIGFFTILLISVFIKSID